jgi:DNA polymerase III subunit delta'
MARAPALQDTEIFPEADRLDGVPHPRMTAKLHGHAAAEQALAGGLAEGRLHHGWLIAGPQGIGKATLAYRFAKAALSKPDERDRAGRSLSVSSETTGSRQVRALSHPGLLVIRRPYLIKDKRFAASIPVDEVRRLRQFLAMSAEPGAWRIVIVDSADELNIAAANALLKSLEEPPPRTLFLMITSEPGRLLPTIRSRCRQLALEALSGPDLRAAAMQALEAEDSAVPAAADWPALERLSHGSVRRALALSAGGGIALNATLTQLIGSLPRLDWLAVHTLADKLAPQAATQQYELFMELLTGLVARLVRASATGQGDAGEIALAARAIPATRLATFADLWETVTREIAEAAALNLDRKTVILDTFARLERASRPA